MLHLVTHSLLIIIIIKKKSFFGFFLGFALSVLDMTIFSVSHRNVDMLKISIIIFHMKKISSFHYWLIAKMSNKFSKLGMFRDSPSRQMI